MMPPQPAPILYSFRRCPYAIRARMALAYAGIVPELREIVLKNKPEALLRISSKGTVPVLLLADGRVIEESLAIMRWSLQQHDADGWLVLDNGHQEDTRQLIDRNDGEFKHTLDRYKYADRHPQHPAEYYRAGAEACLQVLETRLSQSRYLIADRITLADVAIFPFIRQFSMVDLNWFRQSRYQALNRWLLAFEQSVLFLGVMEKHRPWIE